MKESLTNHDMNGNLYKKNKLAILALLVTILLLLPFFAGFFGGLTGTWGPPTVAYFLTLKLERNFQIRSQGIIYFFGSIIFIFAHIHSNIINLASITFSFFLLLPAIVGVLLGNYIGTKIDGKKFTKVTQLLLLIASLNLIRRGFGF